MHAACQIFVPHCLNMIISMFKYIMGVYFLSGANDSVAIW